MQESLKVWSRPDDIVFILHEIVELAVRRPAVQDKRRAPARHSGGKQRKGGSHVQFVTANAHKD